MFYGRSWNSPNPNEFMHQIRCLDGVGRSSNTLPSNKNIFYVDMDGSRRPSDIIQNLIWIHGGFFTHVLCTYVKFVLEMSAAFLVFFLILSYKTLWTKDLFITERQRQQQRQQQRQRYPLNSIKTNRFVHTGVATAMVPQVNGFWPYCCSCSDGKLIVFNCYLPHQCEHFGPIVAEKPLPLPHRVNGS